MERDLTVFNALPMPVRKKNTYGSGDSKAGKLD